MTGSVLVCDRKCDVNVHIFIRKVHINGLFVWWCGIYFVPLWKQFKIIRL